MQAGRESGYGGQLWVLFFILLVMVIILIAGAQQHALLKLAGWPGIARCVLAGHKLKVGIGHAFAEVR